MSSISLTSPSPAVGTAPFAVPTDGASLPAAVALEVLGNGVPLLVGQYGVDLATGRWWWSDEVDTMHGWEPGEVGRSLAALRGRTHPDDRERLVRSAAQALRRRRPFSGAHRVVDAHSRVRMVLVTGEGRPGPDGRVAEIVGHMVDMTPVLRDALDREVTRAVTRAVASAGAVERAKGALMAAGGLDEDGATQRLATAAHAGGLTLPDAAEHLVSAVARVGGAHTDEVVGPALAEVAATSPGVHRGDKAARLTRRQARPGSAASRS